MRLIYALMASTLLVAVARGATVYDNFGPAFATGGDAAEIEGSSSIDFSSFDAAVRFTPLQDYTLDSVVLGLRHLLDPNAYQAYISTDNAGQPQSAANALESWTFSIAGTPTTLASATNATLHANQQYWIVVLAGDALTDGRWKANPIGDSTTHLFRQDGGPWFTVDDIPTPAFAVNGTLVPGGTVPTPSAAAGGLVLLGTAGLRRRRGMV